MIDLDALQAAAVRRLRGSITRSANKHLLAMGIATKGSAEGIVTRKGRNPKGFGGEAIEPALSLATNPPELNATGVK